MIRQQKILIITLAIIFVIMTVAYFAVVRPLTAPEETEKETLTPDEGEDVTYGSHYLMFPQVERADMQSMEVHNEHGTYKFVRNGDGESDFVIEGYENLAYDQELFSQLVVSSGYTMVEKVTENPTEQELIDYGFKNTEGEVPYYILTTKSGDVHKVLIGKKLISGGGYYAMYEGRDTVYFLDVSLEETILKPIESLVTPLLTAGIETTDYYLIDDFTIKHYGEDFLVCRNLTTQELSEMETTALAAAVVTYPADYDVSLFYDQTLQALCYCTGESVAALGIDEENLEKYGLTDAPYEISYEYGGYTYKLTASELSEDGYYYVATSLFKIIVRVPAADFEFLTWDLINWIDTKVFSRNITFVKSIEVMGNDFSEVFNLYHFPTEDPNLAVVGDECGEIDDIANFREFYKTLLLISVEGDAPTDEDIVSEANHMATVKVSTNGGNVTEYSFYRYSTRRALLTINGKGQFYVLVDTPEKIIGDAYKVTQGIPVDALDKN